MRRTIDVVNNTITQGRNTVAIPRGDSEKVLQAIAQRLPADYIDFINVSGNIATGESVDLPHGFNSEVRFYPVDFLPATQLAAYPIVERRISGGADLSDKNTLRLIVWYSGKVAIRVEPV